MLSASPRVEVDLVGGVVIYCEPRDLRDIIPSSGWVWCHCVITSPESDTVRL
ncbi:hypothetical protein DPMN_041408 [Dreissena polymorpha]|uniref:Uncharacterized protein n=1 Tax=Dreissena polymorpha TaxID=45954 RepID=A0A9D4HW64_DREPO|nr:hypothetical protein DPMN_041408 [Dreissena polymorpha]